MSAKIRVDFDAGTSIEKVTGEMVELSKKFGTNVKTKFNGIEISTYGNCTPEKLVKNYKKDLTTLPSSL
jgi:hypothetical protein